MLLKPGISLKANNFGKISDESFPEIIISAGTDKYVFVFENEEQQTAALVEIEEIICL